MMMKKMKMKIMNDDEDENDELMMVNEGENDDE